MYAPRVHSGARHLSLTATVGLVAAVVSSLLVGGARSATPASGLIAFTRSDGIYVIGSDGTGVRPLIRGHIVSGARELAWSRDGSRLAFIGRGGAIWTMGANGKNLVRVLVAGQIGSAQIQSFGSPTWSPDGREIAFTAYDPNAASEGKRDIWIVNADGSELRPVRTPDLFEVDVDWSPSGREFAVASDGYFPHLWVMNTDGSNRRLLTKGGYKSGFAMQPDWSPDGRRIAFKRPGGSFELAAISVTDRSGRNKARLSETTGPSMGGPTWSPDGRRIAFLRDSGSIRSTNSEIYVMKSDGTAVTRLTHNTVAEWFPAWQPVAAP